MYSVGCTVMRLYGYAVVWRLPLAYRTWFSITLLRFFPLFSKVIYCPIEKKANIRYVSRLHVVIFYQLKEKFTNTTLIIIKSVAKLRKF